MRDSMGKYRGRRIDNGEWAFGSLMLTRYDDSTQNAHIRTWDEKSNCWDDLHAVNPKTVGQFTGLKDEKDANIYEGDIISFTYWWFDGNVAESQLIGTIVYSPELMSFQLKGVKNKEWEAFTGYENDREYLTPFSELNFDKSDFEIIGNIHDNKELLEEN